MNEQRTPRSAATRSLRVAAIVLVTLGAVAMSVIVLLMVFGDSLRSGAGAYDPTDYELDADGGSVLAPQMAEEWSRENLAHLGEPAEVRTETYRLIDDMGDGYPFKNTVVVHTYPDMTKAQALALAEGSNEGWTEEDCVSGDDIDPDVVEDPEVVEDCSFFDAFDQEAPLALEISVEWQRRKDGSVSGEVVFEYDPRYE